MDLYLSYKNIPEFKGLPDDLAAFRYRVCVRKSFFYWKQWLGIGQVILSIVLWDLFVKFLPLFGVVVDNLIEDILLIVFSFGGAVAYLLMHNQVIRSVYKSEYPNESKMPNDRNHA